MRQYNLQITGFYAFVSSNHTKVSIFLVVGLLRWKAFTRLRKIKKKLIKRCQSVQVT